MDDRAFARHLAWWAEADLDTEIYAGKPPAISDLELPELDGEVLGSIVRRHENRAVTVEVHYLIHAEPTAALDQLDAALARGDFVGVRPRAHAGGGFQGLPPQWDWTRHFFRGHSGPYFSAYVRPMAPDSTALWLQWQRDAPWHPSEMADRMPGRMQGEGLIPALRPPTQVDIIGTGGGGSGESWATEAFVITPLDPAQLHDHFAEQLRAAGWLRSESAVDRAAWSTWTLPDDDWIGVFIVTPLVATDQRALMIRIWSRRELDRNENRRRSWRTSAILRRGTP